MDHQPNLDEEIKKIKDEIENLKMKLQNLKIEENTFYRDQDGDKKDKVANDPWYNLLSPAYETMKSAICDYIDDLVQADVKLNDEAMNYINIKQLIKAPIDSITKYLLTGIVSKILFKNFEKWDFRVDGDLSPIATSDMHTLKTEYYKQLSSSDHDTQMNKSNTGYPLWYTLVKARYIADIINKLPEGKTPDVFINNAFKKACLHVYAFHCIYYGFYPRPDLIIPCPGCTSLDLCYDGEEFYKPYPEVKATGTVAFMLFPGIQGRTIRNAFVYTEQ